MSFENIYQKIGELKELLIPLNEKINFLYTINQLDKSKMIYKLNLNELIRNLEVYEQYMLKKIIEITSKDWEIGIDELFTEKQLKDVLKHGLLDSNRINSLIKSGDLRGLLGELRGLTILERDNNYTPYYSHILEEDIIKNFTLDKKEQEDKLNG